MRTILAACAMATTSLAMSTETIAHAADPRDAPSAEVLFERARVAVKAGDWENACKLFAASESLDAAPGTLLNLGDCEEHRGRVASAWVHFLEASQLRPNDPRAPFAKQRAKAVERRVPHVSVKLAPDAPDGTHVKRGDTDLDPAALGTPLPLDPGVYIFHVTAPGRSERRFDLEVHEGESRELVVSPGDAPIADDKSDPTSEAMSGTRIAGYALGGIGVAGIALGATTGILALSRASTYRAHCSNGVCDMTGIDAASSGKTVSTLSTIGFIGGGIALAGGIFLLIKSGKDANAPSSQVGVVGTPQGMSFVWQRAVE